MRESPHYLGIDACKGGWVGITINDQGYTSAGKCSSIAQLIAYASDLGNVCVIGIDVPIGLPTKQIRAQFRPHGSRQAARHVVLQENLDGHISP